LTAIGFLNPEQPKKLMPRLKRLFSRTQLETEEVNILRGIAKKILDK
ncbi:MAG: tRNA (cytosine(32)/uridine(32)-2'-O)-methyltransferase TrmJ, partial [Oxalobacteraceae bacterium]